VILAFGATASADLRVVRGTDFVKSAGAYEPFVAICSGNESVMQVFRMDREAWRLAGSCPAGQVQPVAIVLWDAGWLLWTGITLTLLGTVAQAYLTATEERR
jgi:hypothetical protein